MRLGYPTEDNNKKIVTRPQTPMKLGFHTTPVSPPEVKPTVKHPKIIIHTRLGFPTTPPRPPALETIRSTFTPPKLKPLPLNLKPSPSCVLPTMKAPGDLVSIIILTHNTLNVTSDCIRSVLEKTVHPFELFVVDNASRDGTVDWLKMETYLTLIANSRNFSFSKANNLAIRCARGKYVCLLNSDIIVQTKGWLSHLVKVAESSHLIGTVGAKLLYPNGKIQHLGGGIHNKNPYHPYDKYPANIKEAYVTRDVPYNTGACLLITQAALKQVGLLDEDYPFGFEDVDYGLRVVENGLRNRVCHEAVLTHLWAYTQRTTRKGITTGSLSRFHAKWDNKLSSLAKKVTLSWGAPFCV